MVDIFSLLNSIAGWNRKESDIVQLHDADFYSWRHYIELTVCDWKEEKYVSKLFVCAQIIAECFPSKYRWNSANAIYKG